MSARATVVFLAVPLVWLGMVPGISSLEIPLKFRAPGVTVSLGPGICRLIFRAPQRGRTRSRRRPHVGRAH